jgi:hypothetical protein
MTTDDEVTMLRQLINDYRAALWECTLLSHQIAQHPFELDDGQGGKVCFYGCGYGTLEGLPESMTAQDKEMVRYGHREMCLAGRAAQEPMRLVRKLRLQEWGGECKVSGSPPPTLRRVIRRVP